MKIRALGFIGFTSPNHESWRSWAPQTLGLGLADDGKDGAIRLRMDARHHRIAIHPGATEDLAYLGWELTDRVAFEAALAELEQKQVPYRLATPEELDSRRVVNMAWLTDPYGYRHEIYHGQQFVYGGFLAGNSISGFRLGKHGELGIGHCVLVVPEITRAGMDFAVNVLGFKTHWPTGEVEFYRCNTRSHCLAYVPVPGLRGPHHFYIDVLNFDDVGIAFDRCREQNRVVMELGRLAQDSDVSFYLRTPSGVNVQYAHGCHLIEDEAAWVEPSMMTHPRVWGHKEILPIFGPAIRRVDGGDLDQ